MVNHLETKVNSTTVFHPIQRWKRWTVETLTKCLTGKVSNAKMKTTISTLVSILNGCVDEITRQEENSYVRTLLDMGDLLFISLREYRDYMVTHSNWKNICL
jgi:hypothetical protein